MKIPRILYHFTPRHLLDGCKSDGLTLGRTPILLDGQIAIFGGWQWLTANPSFDQSWTDPELSKLPYDRTECRITVRVPSFYKKNLFCSDEWISELGDFMFPSFVYGDDYKNWFVYKGRVKPGWFRSVDYKP